MKVLYGDVNPSGHLPETFPKKLSDNPSYLFYGGEGNRTEYREGIFVGYRYYDKKDLDVLFPFGHGLSYTTFEYSNLRLSADKIKDTDTLTATVTVKNTGNRAGKAVAQLYVGDVDGNVIRPVRELKGFEKIALEPGESRDVSFTLDKRSFAYWNEQLHDWHVESGDFTVEVGGSSRELPVCAKVCVESTVALPRHYDMNTIFMDLKADPKAYAVFQPVFEGMHKMFSGGDDAPKAEDPIIKDEMMDAMLQYFPLRNLLSFGAGMTEEQLQALIDQANQA